MADESGEQPTERTPKGFQVPIPKRGEFFANLKKVAKPQPRPSEAHGKSQHRPPPRSGGRGR